MKNLRMVRTTLVAGVAACSLPVSGGGPSGAPQPMLAVATDTADIATVVQVRGFRNSSVVSVVAWDANDAAIGLRASVTRTGRLVGGPRHGDHRLYMVPLFVQRMGGFNYASVTRGRLLLTAGPQRDYYSCFYGKECSPPVTVGLGVPDSVLRANRDSLVVTFYPTSVDPWTITLRRELISPYLDKVDSLVAEFKKTATTFRESSSLPLDRRGRLGADVVHDAVDPHDLIDDAARDARQHLVRKRVPVGRHSIRAGDGA